MRYELLTFLVLGVWVIGTVCDALIKQTKLAVFCYWSGFGLIGYYISSLWLTLERPPIKTLGETRLWYALFLPLIGLSIFHRFKIRWIVYYSLLMSALFLLIDFFKPEAFDKTLPPALQSPWFIPHVIVYMMAYALLAASSFFAFRGIFSKQDLAFLNIADNVVYIGFSLLSMGLIFGALWAKEAWGHYWTWDPKETWALLTWLCYLVYIHLRHRYREHNRPVLFFLAFSFLVLLMCWFGMNYLPSAQSSVHAYS